MGILDAVTLAQLTLRAYQAAAQHRHSQLAAANDKARFVTLALSDVDAVRCPANVVAFEHSQGGVASDMAAIGVLSTPEKPFALGPLPPGHHRIIETPPGVPGRRFLVVGVEPPGQFSYPQVRNFGDSLCAILAGDAPDTRHVALAVPGAWIALNELRSVEHFLQGVIKALTTHRYPVGLERITLSVPGEASRKVLANALNALFRDIPLPRDWKNEENTWPIVFYPSGDVAESQTAIEAPLETALSHPEYLTAFVAMPFIGDMKDVWYFGIDEPATAAGFRCERLDQESFTGDVVEEIKRRIEQAHLVIADLTLANANVFLEVGFAWGKGRSTVLLWNKKAAGKGKKKIEKPFDVRTQRCLEYESIHELKQMLQKELAELYPKLKQELVQRGGGLL